MRIKDLIQQLQALTEEDQNAAIDIFDAKTGTYHPVTTLKPYDPHNHRLSALNPLTIVINKGGR